MINTFQSRAQDKTNSVTQTPKTPPKKRHNPIEYLSIPPSGVQTQGTSHPLIIPQPTRRQPSPISTTHTSPTTPLLSLLLQAPSHLPSPRPKTEKEKEKEKDPNSPLLHPNLINPSISLTHPRSPHTPHDGAPGKHDRDVARDEQRGVLGCPLEEVIDHVCLRFAECWMLDAGC